MVSHYNDTTFIFFMIYFFVNNIRYPPLTLLFFMKHDILIVDILSKYDNEMRLIFLADINIVLVEPEIPQNTGNIARTCAATGASLHLVEPMGFKIDDRKLKRAGLDYWDKLDITYYSSLDDFFKRNRGETMYFFTTKAPRAYTEPLFPKRCFLLFGKETKGLPESLLEAHPDACLRIPMLDHLRSLNLSNSAAIAVYELLRQRNFDGLREAGQPTTFDWENL